MSMPHSTDAESCAPSTTRATKLTAPAAVGVPVIAPVVGSISSPAGSGVAEKRYGAAPPVARKVELYATPTRPLVLSGHKRAMRAAAIERLHVMRAESLTASRT